MSYDPDLDRLDLILEMIGHLNRRLGGATLQVLLTDRDELDLSAYRLAVIGEAANKLSAIVRARHPNIAWSAMYRMRNIITHDYGSVDPVQVWSTVTLDLEPLAAVCRAELARTD